MLLQDDRQRYGIGGAIRKIASKFKSKAEAKANKEIDESTRQMKLDNLDSFDFEEAATMFNAGDISLSDINKNLKAAGYPAEDIDDFIYLLSDTKGKSPDALIKERKKIIKKQDEKSQKKRNPDNMTDEELEKEYDRLADEFAVDNSRFEKNKGGLLSEDRQAYGVGNIVKKLIKNKPSKNTKKVKELEKEMDDYLAQYKKLDDEAKQAVKKAREDSLSLEERNELADLYSGYYKLLNENISDVAEELEELGIKVSKKNLKERKIPSPKESGDYKRGELLPLNKGGLLSEDRYKVKDGGLLSDNDMEENYTRFIMDEALSDEEEDMLVSKLEQDKELQTLFDKVIDVAQEFAGSGPVEGPGSGVSDSIPARLSDGEFVFTAKAVEEIGEDNLMSMMKEAEAKADERQGFAEGMMVEEEQPKPLLSQTGIVQETSTDEQIRDAMIDNPTRRIFS